MPADPSQNGRTTWGAGDLNTSQQQFFDTELQMQMQMQHTSQVQRSRIISQAQKFDTNYQPQNNAAALPLSKQKLTVTQHNQQQQLQNVTTSSLQQHTPSQGIQNIFADPNYGIVSVHAEMAGNSTAQAAAASRHLVQQQQHHYSPSSHNNNNSQQMPHQQESFSAPPDPNHCMLHLDSSQVVMQTSQQQMSGSQLPNGSVIRIQKSKYQGLIKHRGAPIIVQSPNLTGSAHKNHNHHPHAASSLQNQHQNGSRGGDQRIDDGFDTPQRMAQIQQIYNLNHQHQSKILHQLQQQFYDSEQVAASAKDGGEIIGPAPAQLSGGYHQVVGNGGSNKQYSLSSNPGSGMRKLEMVAIDDNMSGNEKEESR